MVELEIVHQGEVVHRHPLSLRAITLGRSSSNEIILRAPDVSGQHAVVFLKNNLPHVRDLRSANGTWINGHRLHGIARIETGDQIRFGASIEVRLINLRHHTHGPLRLQQASGPIAYPIISQPFTIPSTEATLMWQGGQHWLTTPGESPRRIDLHTTFQAAGQAWQLVEAIGTEDTIGQAPELVPYHLAVDLDRSWATLGDGEHHCTIRSEHRVALLYMLGREWSSQTPGPERGWTPDQDLGVGIWGQRRYAQLPNNLNVLIHRLRKQIEGSGLDAKGIQRRHGYTRLHLREALLQPS